MSGTCRNCKYSKMRYSHESYGIFPFNGTTTYGWLVCMANPPQGSGFPAVAEDDSCRLFERG